MLTKATGIPQSAWVWLFALLTLVSLAAWLSFASVLIAQLIWDSDLLDVLLANDLGWVWAAAGWLGLTTIPLFGALACIYFCPTGPVAMVSRHIGLGLSGAACILVGLAGIGGVHLIAGPVAIVSLPVGAFALYELWQQHS